MFYYILVRKEEWAMSATFWNLRRRKAKELAEQEVSREEIQEPKEEKKPAKKVKKNVK